jgi:protein O-GlcNAc transferase
VSAAAYQKLSQAGQLLARGDVAAALPLLEEAAALAPGEAAIWAHLGMARAGAGDGDGAEAALRKATELNDSLAEAHAMLGMLLSARQRIAEAEPALRRAVALAPGRSDVVYALTRALTETGRADEAITILRRAIAANAADPLLQSKLCMMLNYTPASAAEIFQEHARFGAMLPAPATQAPAPALAVDDPDRPLRIGYVSADLREHSVPYFLEPILERHDRSAAAVYMYQLAPGDETVTPRLKALCDRWRVSFPSSDEQLTAQIAHDRIDILVELGGHTSGNRLSAMARRPAPIQVTYLGYPNTTGLRAIDYRLVDDLTDPSPEADALAVERLVRLPGCFVCYGPPRGAPEPAPPPVERTGSITFGSFNSLAKLSAPTVALWSRLLMSIPGSRLALKGKALGEAVISEQFRCRFAAQGLDPSRLILLSHTPSTREHLEAYAQVDIALDPFPYNGTTTTCEALWMGIPVVTLLGDRHAARVGVSLLNAAGLPELIAGNEAAYLDRGRALAASPGDLARMRRSLRGRVRGSILCDAGRFTTNLEAAYRQMWREWCAVGRGP